MKALFHSDAWLGVKASMLLLLSLVSMVMESRYHLLTQTRSIMAQVVVPLQYVVDAPFNFTQRVVTGLDSKTDLVEQNASLRRERLILNAQLQRLQLLQHENQQLRTLMKATKRLKTRLLVARLLAVRTGLFGQQMVLNVGSRQGVYRGQPVLDAFGVVGQVVEVSTGSCRVLVVSDVKSGVPIQNARNGYRAIAVGTGMSDHLELAHVNLSADFRSGDVLVTSGMGERFPVGYPVGEVVRVEIPKGASFARIIVRPMAHLNRSRDMVLVWSHQQERNQQRPLKQKSGRELRHHSSMRRAS